MDGARTNRHQLLLDLASAGESGILPPGSDHGRKHKKRRLSGSASARPGAATDSSGDETFAENQRHGSSDVGGFPLYLRKPRPSLISDVLGSKMLLEPGCGLYESLLFGPQLLDRKEVGYLRTKLRPEDCFVDVGAHIGFYTLLASRCLGAEGRELAIEAHPRFREELPPLEGDRCHRGWVQAVGDYAGRSWRAGVAAMKVEIEGMEFRVLKHFFGKAPRSMWPRLILVEHIEAMQSVSGGWSHSC